MRKFLIFIILIFSFSPHLYAQENDINKLQEEIMLLKSQFEEIKTSYEKKIEQLEAKLEQLEEEEKTTASKATQVASIQQARNFQSFNPDVSVIGDFTTFSTDQKGDEQYNRFNLRQAELAFSSYVDPYARADLFMHVEPGENEWHLGLCEGYLTLLELPHNLQAKIGKVKANFGKINRQHLHSLPWVDYPNMLTNYFGEEGMSAPGVSISGLLPNPWDQYIELTFEAFNNNNSTSFASSDKKDIVYLAHLKNFFELNEKSTLEIGGSFATGLNDDGHNKNRTNLVGIDITYKWRPLREGLYKSLTFQNELLVSHKNQSDGRQRIDSWGAYSSLEYKFSRRWSAFGRFDYSEFPDYSSRHDKAISLGLTFAQSEYCFWRLQFKHTNRNYDKDTNEVWLQCNFGLGPHRAHEY